MEGLQPGHVFAGHRIESVAGRGGMGVVYRAVQLDLDRVVALKLIASALADDPAFRRRFVGESRAAASIEHPNVIPIFYAGEEEGTLYLAMRFVDGDDLRTLVRAEGPLEPVRAARVVAQVASALGAAHARGLVHRDVKPANVLLAEDHAYLTDFGLTRRVASRSGVTRAGGWVGTLGYVAPEQIRDEDVDARTDVYALGCVLFHALTGRPPFERSTDEATLWAHLEEPAPGLPDRAPPALDQVVRRALAKRPEDRFASAPEMGRALLAAVGEPATAVAGLTADRPAARSEEDEDAPTAESPGRAPATSATAVPGGGRRPPRRRLAVPAAAVLAVLGVVAAALALSGADEPAPRPRAAPAPASDAPARVAWTQRVGGRPNTLAYARGVIWTSHPRSDRLIRLDARTGRRLPAGPRVGRGVLSLDAGLGALWATRSQGRPELVRVSLESARVVRRTQLPGGDPVSLDTGRDAVWVGLRPHTRSGAPPPRVLKVHPRESRVLRELAVPLGVQGLAVGPDALWVSNAERDTVTRIDLRTGRRSLVSVGAEPAGLDVGGGALWVVNSADDTVSRIELPGRLGTPTVVPRLPRGLAVAGERVWVSSYAASTVTVLDARGEPVGEPLRVARAPFRVVARDGEAWVASVGEGAVQRLVASP